MNEMTIPLAFTGVLGLGLAGLVGFAKISARGKGSMPVLHNLTASEKLVDVVDILEERFFLTTTGSLVALFSIQPVVSTTETSPETLSPAFVSILHALEPKTSLQIVQFPLPGDFGALAERYAKHAHKWREEIEKAQAEANATWVETASNRYFAATQIGGEILEVGAAAAQRRAYLVLSRSTGISGKATPAALTKAVENLKVDGERLMALFAANGMPIVALGAREALELLWHAYNPERGGLALMGDLQERFIEIVEAGEASRPASLAFSREEIERVLENPREELGRFLAPILIEEGEASVRFHTREMILYFVTDFHTAIPEIRRLFGRDGRFASRLYISYYVTSPSGDEMARSARKASTAKQALQTIALRAGSLPSYKQAEEVASIEDARAGAETEKDVPKLLGLYIGLLTSPETSQADAIELESILRSAGVEFVPARWMALDVWRTLLPLAERRHSYEGRNVFAANLAPLNPATSVALFDPEGEFAGFVDWGENAGSPVALRRERGGEFIPSDAVVGAQGSGKSFLLKFWLTDWIARGERAFVVDPKLEFGMVTRSLGGKGIALGGSQGFNLLQFEALPATPGSELGSAVASLVFADNLAALEALYSLAKGGRGRASGVERNHLINALKRALVLKEMDPKDASTWRPDRVFLADVYEVLTREMLQEDPQTIRMMAGILEQYSAKSGQYFEQYNTPNDFSLDADLVTATFGLSNLSMDETAKSLSAHFAMRIAVSHAVRSFLLSPKPTPFHIVIDEASQLLTTPALVASVASMLSLLSAYGISVHLAFQTMDALRRADALGAAEGAASINTLTGVIPAYWLFHQEPSSAQAAVEMLGLPRGLGPAIVRQPVGACILAFPGADLRVPLRVRVPEAFQAMFRTDPQAMRGLVDDALAVKPIAAEGNGVP